VLPQAQARVVERREQTAQLRIDLSRCAPHGDVRYVRTADGGSRDIADVADRSLGRLNWAQAV
jgi:hypothetical protein